jgi:uncharacterized lipoprotein YddW (UPF0748 family)
MQSPSRFDHFADGVVSLSRRWGRPGWLIFLIIFTFILVTQLPLNAQQSHHHRPAQAVMPTSEIRGVWLTNVDSEVLFGSQKVESAVKTLSEMNFNTLYPTVWNWGYTLYPSAIAQKTIGVANDPHEGLKGRDMLREVSTLGHKKSMTVIPWFEFGFMAPADSTLAQRYPQWLTQRQDRSTVWLEGNTHKRVWLNPLHPEVQALITNLVVEILQNYETDGIQFDDHFGYPSDFGYDSYTVNLYRQEHGNKAPPSNPQDPEWIQWRADKITSYMTQLAKTIRQIKPKAIISLSPNPQDFSLSSYLLDWAEWERRGLVDELVLQVYRFDLKDFQRELNHMAVQTAKQKIPFAVGILSGLKGRPVTLSQIQDQVAAAREQKFNGVSFFFFESLWNFGQESVKERQAAFKSIFPQPVPRPVRPV